MRPFRARFEIDRSCLRPLYGIWCDRCARHARRTQFRNAQEGDDELATGSAIASRRLRVTCSGSNDASLDHRRVLVALNATSSGTVAVAYRREMHVTFMIGCGSSTTRSVVNTNERLPGR